MYNSCDTVERSYIFIIIHLPKFSKIKKCYASLIYSNKLNLFFEFTEKLSFGINRLINSTISDSNFKILTPSTVNSNSISNNILSLGKKGKDSCSLNKLKFESKDLENKASMNESDFRSTLISSPIFKHLEAKKPLLR